MRKNNFMQLFEKCDESLKDLAFTHSSYAHQHGCQSNERIEFLGDTVLSTIVSDCLYKNYNLPEGKMTKIRSSFVCTDSLGALAKKLKIESKIKFGKSFKDEISDAILADTIESMIGVMYLSYGLPSIQSAILEALEVKETMKKGLKATDYKSLIQEYAQSNKLKLEYKTETHETKDGKSNFRSNVMINKEFIAYGQGSTKREAEQNAARLAIKKLDKGE